MKIVLPNRPASKKNSKRIFYSKNTGRPIIFPSKAYTGWHDDMMGYLLEWKVKNNFKKPIQKPIKGIFTFMQKGNMRQDISNALLSVEDVLQDAGIIEDDNLFQEEHLYKIQHCQDWSTIVELEDL